TPRKSGPAPSTAAPAGSSPPGNWSGTPQPSIPTGRPPTSCCGRIRTSASDACTGAGGGRTASTGLWVVASPFLETPLPGRPLVVLVVDDPQDLDEAEGSPKPAQGRLLVGVDLS